LDFANERINKRRSEMQPENALRTPEDSAATPDSGVEARMADLATFTNGVVHDLRNPLNVIRTNIYLLRQRLTGDDPKATRAIDRIDDQVTAAMRLLEGYQAFYRSDAPTLQRVQVNEIIGNLEGALVLPEGIELVLSRGEDLPIVTADPQLLEAAVRALVRNAVEAMPAGGTLRIGAQSSEGSVSLVVEDTGAGIPEEVRTRAFEPLFTTRRAQAGLGLALVDKIARVHGGRARLDSAEGHGTRVAIELPAG
jgi:signal transduction histidine kinase